MSGLLSFLSDAWNFVSNLVVTIVTELRTFVDLILIILDGQWWTTMVAFVPAVFMTSAILSLILIVILRIYGRR